MSHPRCDRMPGYRGRAKRVNSGGSLVVEVKTIGAPMAYRMVAKNASRTGLLLQRQSNQNVPFLENTILELDIDPDGHSITDPLRCLGKVVRLDQTGRSICAYGVEIIQMGKWEQRAWEGRLINLRPREVLSRSVA